MKYEDYAKGLRDAASDTEDSIKSQFIRSAQNDLKGYMVKNPKNKKDQHMNTAISNLNDAVNALDHHDYDRASKRAYAAASELVEASRL